MKASSHGYVEQVSLVSSVRNETDSKTLLQRPYASRRHGHKGLFGLKRKTIPDVAVNPTDESLETTDEPSITRWRFLCCWMKNPLAQLSPSLSSSLTSFPTFHGGRFPPLRSVEYPANTSFPTQSKTTVKPKAKPEVPQFSLEEKNWEHHVDHLRDWSPVSQHKVFSPLTQPPGDPTFPHAPFQKVPLSGPTETDMHFSHAPSLKVPFSRPTEANQDILRKRFPKPRVLLFPFTLQSRSADPVMDFRLRSSPPSSRSSSESSIQTEGTDFDLHEKIILKSSPSWSPSPTSKTRDALSKEWNVATDIVHQQAYKARFTSPRDNTSTSHSASQSFNNSICTPAFIHPQSDDDPLVEQSRAEDWSQQSDRDWSPERLRPFSPLRLSEKLKSSNSARIFYPDPKDTLLKDWLPSADWTTPSTAWFGGDTSQGSWNSPATVKVCCKCHNKIDPRDFDPHHKERKEVNPFETSRPKVPRGSSSAKKRSKASDGRNEQRKIFSPFPDAKLSGARSEPRQLFSPSSDAKASGGKNKQYKIFSPSPDAKPSDARNEQRTLLTPSPDAKPSDDRNEQCTLFSPSVDAKPSSGRNKQYKIFAASPSAKPSDARNEQCELLSPSSDVKPSGDRSGQHKLFSPETQPSGDRNEQRNFSQPGTKPSGDRNEQRNFSPPGTKLSGDRNEERKLFSPSPVAKPRGGKNAKHKLFLPEAKLFEREEINPFETSGPKFLVGPYSAKKRSDVSVGRNGQPKLFLPNAQSIASPGDLSSISGLVSIDSLVTSHWDSPEVPESPAKPLASNQYAEHLDFLQTRVTDY